MAQYKVPQDVEAEDKLLGPFTFRQFIYLIIAIASVAAAWGLFQLFPLLAILPLPFAAFFAILALPLRKDQPMETYLTAVVSYHIKPKKRFWLPGQRETSIAITAPRIIEKPRARNLTGEEASNRLSFLADIIDTEGRSIRGDYNSSMKEEYVAEAESAIDILDQPNVIDQMIAREQTNHHAAIVAQMRAQLEANQKAETSPFINNSFHQ